MTQKSITGTVVSDKMAKTVIVQVATTTRHRLYKKIMRRTKRYLAHDDRLGAKPGDTVRIVETRPLSRLKRWRVAEIVERGEVAEIAPGEIDAEYLSRPREKETPAAPAPASAAFAEAGEATAEMPATNEPAASAENEQVTVDDEAAEPIEDSEP
jgi:small subunit ribosomal protein S17